jgi:hypothetical protein
MLPLDLFAQLDDFDIKGSQRPGNVRVTLFLSSLSKMIINRDLLKIK